MTNPIILGGLMLAFYLCALTDSAPANADAGVL